VGSALATADDTFIPCPCCRPQSFCRSLIHLHRNSAPSRGVFVSAHNSVRFRRFDSEVLVPASAGMTDWEMLVRADSAMRSDGEKKPVRRIESRRIGKCCSRRIGRSWKHTRRNKPRFHNCEPSQSFASTAAAKSALATRSASRIGRSGRGCFAKSTVHKVRSQTSPYREVH
jgi:hypothetical protein